MLTVSMLLQYARNREQNLHALYRACKKFIAAYDEHEKVKASMGSLLENTQTTLESARSHLAQVADYEENSQNWAMRQANPKRPRRKRGC